MLPDGRGILFTIALQRTEENAIAVLDLRSGQQKVLVRGGSQPEYVEAPGGARGEPGYLIFGAAGTLRAVRFDLKTLDVKGDVWSIVDHVMTAVQSGATNYAVSTTGALFYLPGTVGVGETGKRTLVFVTNGEGTFEPREVTTGMKVRNYYEIKSGLSAGEKVATGANFLIDSESKLKAAISGAGSAHQHGP